MLVACALSTTFPPNDARGFAGHAAIRVGGALDTLVLEVASGACRLATSVVAVTLHTQPRGEVAARVLRVAVERTGTRHAAAVAVDITRAFLAIGVSEALHTT